MRQPFPVLVYPVAQTDREWKYLLLRRVSNPLLGLGSFWQGVTGGLEDGENLMQAAQRELAEETGFTPWALEQIDYSYAFPMQDKWRKMYAASVHEIMEYVFVALVDHQREPSLSQEHDQWQWCTLSQALGVLSYTGNIEALKRCSIT